ncbi:hypothetical protein [Mycolicibacterium gadium]|jgi:hypothetical protein|uniref:hypothetical protein n=1 Tax=Mycolicibacterium gadium TaxID=1794 RepID=UPI002FDC9CF7
MRTSITFGLVVAATVVGGLFGSLLDRALVATPAWRHLGVQGWADYSRHADLGSGKIVYPVCAILLWALIFAAAVSHRFDRSAPRATGVPIYLAALLSVGAIIATIIAAPIMLSVASLGNDPAALQSAFDRFTLWGVYIRGAFFALSFLCAVWAVTMVSRDLTRARTGQFPAHGQATPDPAGTRGASEHP